jgi:MFS family permease
MYAHERENWFPRLHAAAVLGGTYTAFAMLIFAEPQSISGVSFLVLIPAGILLPFFASLVAFAVFAPVSFGLYRLMERFGRRNLSDHCLAGVVCVTLTFAFICLAAYVASLVENAPEPPEDIGLYGQPFGWQDQLFFAACAISGAADGAAFYLARKTGSSGDPAKANGERS